MTPNADPNDAKPHKPIFNLIGPELKQPGQRRYNTSRDLAYFFPSLMASVAESLSHFASDPNLVVVMKQTNTSPDHLRDVLIKIGEFCRDVCERSFNSGQEVQETAVRVGLEGMHPGALSIVFSRMGKALLAMFHESYMDAFVSGIRPSLSESDLRQAALKFLTPAVYTEVINLTPAATPK